MRGGNVPLRDAISSSEEKGVERMGKNRLFRMLAPVALACGLVGCGAVGDFIATEAYDVAMTNVERTRTTRWQIIIIGGHHDPYEYTLDGGETRDATVHVQSRYNSGSYGPTNNEYRYADVRISAKNLSTGQAYGPIPAQLHWPGVTGIRVGGGSPAIAQPDPKDPTKTILVAIPPGPENTGGIQ